MIKEFKKSVNAILYERVTSPFWGVMILSFLTWNWEILYLTFFIPSDKLEITKIEYIKDYISCNHWNLYWGPLVTLIIILGLFPFISNGVFWWSLKFNIWKKKQKRILENKTLLSIEESIELRDEIHQQNEIFEKLTKRKNEISSDLSKKLKSVEEEKDKMYKEVERKKEKITKLELQLKSCREKQNFSNIFKKTSIYDVKNKGKWRFRIKNLNEIIFTKDDENVKFELFLIENYETNSFEILMYPEGLAEEGLEIKIIYIKRTKEIHEFEGNEISFLRKNNELVRSEINPIKIYTL